MENLTVERGPEPELEVIEPEIVGLDPEPPWWRRMLARIAPSLLLGILGIGLCVVGLVLTISLVGAALGLPLLLIGICVLLLAFFLLLGRGRSKTTVLRYPK